ncbi:WAP four-disulfide core domain protein 18-like [Manis pentadactyla]|uniref:WAP four-disulfide core domain protein 18-like n=1 Tax=Manis pentadactyla TaxID=143292 RepID=UPI0018737C37|nr:WAP four-disulfide core domain protein 18-like [Manis pentadactyla]KAI5222731.1 Anosmin-1 [Manis pentadactyla]
MCITSEANMKTGTVFVLVAFITMGLEMACAQRSFRGKERPGVCPEVPKGTIGVCVELCAGDESCPEGSKCCSNGCGHVCKHVSSNGGSVNV